MEWTPRWVTFFRRVAIIGGLFWIIDGVASLVHGYPIWGIAQIAIGVPTLLFARRIWASIGRRATDGDTRR